MARSFRVGSVQLWRNGFLSLTTIGLGAMILFLLNIVFGVRYLSDVQLQSLEQRATFSIELSTEYDSFLLDGLLNALNTYRVTTEVLPLSDWQGYTIPPRLRLQFQSLEDVKPAFEQVKNPRYTELVGDYDVQEETQFQTIITRLLALRKGTETVGLLLAGIFSIGGVFLFLNAFQLSLFARKDEIEIAEVVGADPSFIRNPLLAEGFLMGLFASFVAILLFTLSLFFVDFVSVGPVFAHLFDSVFALELAFAGLVGVAGAWAAAWRYLGRR